MDLQVREEHLSKMPIPSHSVDWRFLLPLDENTKFLVIHNEQTDYERSFRELGINAELTTLDLVGEKLGDYDVVAAPLGLNSASSGKGRSELVEEYRNILHSIRPGCVFLMGFSNYWSIRKIAYIPYPSSILQMRRLFRGLGFQELRFFGAVPEPLAPEFIFPLSAHLLGFVLNHRYQHRFPGTILALARTPAVNVLLHFLPFYYLVAVAQENA